MRWRRWWLMIGRPRPSFRPVLYLMMFGAAVRLAVVRLEPPPLDRLLGVGAYEVWLGLGIGSPPLALVAWWMIRCRGGTTRYLGLWGRLVSDIGAATSVAALHVATVLAEPLTEGQIFIHYLMGAVMLYLLAVLATDIAALMVVERIARRG